MTTGFDHEPFFSLQAGHSELACADCHAEKKYVGIGTAEAWSPAVLTQHKFELKHGNEEITTCETCHAGNYTEYPCGTCHNEGEMVSVHFQQGIHEVRNCISCHPTGRGKASMPGQGTEGAGQLGQGTPNMQPTLPAPIIIQQPTERPVQQQNQGPNQTNP